MGHIEREIKILNVDVEKVIKNLKGKKINPKGRFIQDVYTFDIPTVEKLYKKYVDDFIKDNDNRKIIKLVREVRPCFSKNDIEIIKNEIGNSDLLEFIQEGKDKEKLKSRKMINLMKRVNENFSKWIRLRKTGDKTTITIKKIIDSKGKYALDNVDELEFDIPDIETGKEFLEDLGYFFARHQIKMRIAYDYKNTEIVIDKWPRLNPYIEVEGPNKEEIDEAVKMLGYSETDEIIINTDDVYMQEAGIDIYSKEYSDLSFSKNEAAEVKKYLEFSE